MTDLNIVCFLSVARSRSFTIAASELSMTQQGVSRNILTLEEELGHRLLHRNTNSVSLTHAGERFFDWCVRFGRTLESATLNFERIVIDRATVNVGLCDWVGCPTPISERLFHFCKENPEVDINFTLASMPALEKGLQNHTTDFAILTSKNAGQLRDVIVSPPLASVPLHVVLSRSHPFANDSISLSTIFSLPHITTSHENEDVPQKTIDRIHIFSRQLGLAPGIVEVVPDMRIALNRVLNGHGFVVTPYEFDSYAKKQLYLRTVPSFSPVVVSVRQRSHANIWAKKLENYLVYGRTDLHE